MRFVLLLVAVTCLPAAEISLPSKALERSGTVYGVYHTGRLATGTGVLSVEWTDSFGRTIASEKIALSLSDETEIRFPLPVYRAIAMKNHLRAHLSFHGKNRKGETDDREEDAETDFVAKPPAGWRDYAILMWQNHTTREYAGLKRAGINGGQFGDRRGNGIPEFMLDNNLRWYVENVATDFYSEYHRYFGDRPNQWRYLEAKEAHKKDPASLEPFKRHPSLSDPVWLKKVHDRLIDAVHFYSAYRPYFYNLGDESGIADLAAFWDFDFSDQSIEAMRTWLKERYGTLAALNSQWGKHFNGWNQVLPETTDEAMMRTDDNYSSWSDFKEWMDIAYASALKMGADAVHSVDPGAFVGIEGAQMPGWGGYDYARITKSVNAIEPYDIGNNHELIRSFAPAMAVLTTSFQSGPQERHRVWHELLNGNRGLIIWDEKPVFVNPDGTLGPRGEEVAPYYNEIRDGIGAQIINSRQLADPIAIHYSQPSMRAEWMLAERSKGPKWVERNSSTERKDSEFLRLRESYCKLIEDQGLQYKFVSYDQVEQGGLITGGYKVLILPRSSALSGAEVQNIRDFIARGGTVIADGQPGVFDEHVRRLAQPSLADLFAGGSKRAILLKETALDYHQLRLMNQERALHEHFRQLLTAAGVQPLIAVTDGYGNPVTGVRVHTYRSGGVLLLAIESNPDMRVDELGPPEFRSNERFSKPVPLKVALPFEANVYDVRGSQALGRKHDFAITLQPYEPLVFSISPVELPALALSASPRVSRGADLRIGVAPQGDSPAAMHVVHIDILDPAGHVVDYYSGNLLAAAGRGSELVPLAINDAAGQWKVRVHDLLSGQRLEATFEVY